MIAKYVESSDGKTFYWSAGEGRDGIVFIHGATADHMLFRYQFDFFKSDFRVIAMDVPAHGLSRPYKNFALQKVTDQLLKILDVEGIKRVHVVGQSMGGYIAQLLAMFHPERVTSLIMVGASPIQSQYYSKLDRYLLQLTPLILRIYPYNLLIKTIASQVAVTEEGKKYMLNTLKQYSQTEIVVIMKAVYRGLQACSKNIALEVPILLTYGNKDTAGKVKSYCNKWSEKEHLPLVVIPNAAHNANMDNPAFFNALIKRFISNI